MFHRNGCQQLKAILKPRTQGLKPGGGLELAPWAVVSGTLLQKVKARGILKVAS